jgi:AcrR family transcriptional regulator
VGKQEKPYHHPDLRSKLLSTATQIIAEKGAEGITLRELARRSGVSRTALYRHFSDKSELLAAVAEEGFRRLTDRCRKAGEKSGADPAAALENVFMAYVEFAVENPTHYRLMFGRKILNIVEYPGLMAAAWQLYNELIVLVKENQRARRIRPGTPADLAHVIWSLAHGLSLLVIDERVRGAAKGRTLAAFAIRSVLDGIRP